MSQSYHHGDLRAELISKGLLILDREGYEAFSLRKVASACNVSQTAPYRHFKDKDELIAAISVQAMQEFNQGLEEAAHKDNDPRVALKEMGIAYIRFFAENPKYLRLMFLNVPGFKVNDEVCSPEAHMQIGHPFATLYRAVKRYKEAYPSETMGQKELVLYCWGLVHGLAALIVNRVIPNDEDNIELAEKIIWNGDFLK